MGITGASLPSQWRWAAALVIGAVGGCTAGSVIARRPTGVPVPAGREVEIRIGLLVGAGSVDIGGTGPVAVNHPDGSPIGTIPAGETWQVLVGQDGLTFASSRGRVPVSARFEAMTVAPADPRSLLRLNSKHYRGVAEILRDRTGLTVVNRVGMESYLVSVVSTELGRRSSAELEALRAQAVVSRTYAIRNLRRWRSQGFDLYATVTDQAYGGAGVETQEARAAVNETRGRVLTYDGALVEAFYYSTCGGRTAEGFEVFRGASRPYLRSIPDMAENGAAYCSISPRYRWREERSGEALRASLQPHLPRGPLAGSDVVDVRVTQRSASGRVDQLALTIGGSEVRLDGHAIIRQVLRNQAGDLLRSTAFTLVATGAGRKVTRLVVEGMGAGHGVGLCQWGAVGRARAGHSYQRILAAYYPGTRLDRRY